MGEKSRLVKAATGKESLRTTVPMSIVKQWGLHEGDDIEWSLEIRGNEMIVIVTKTKTQ